MVKDFGAIIYTDTDLSENFIESDYLTTVIVVVPKFKIPVFLGLYENIETAKLTSDIHLDGMGPTIGVVPDSAKYLNLEDKDGN